MATNGNERLQTQEVEAVLRAAQVSPMKETPREFSLMELARYLAQHGQEQQEMVRTFATQLVEMERRKLAYIEQIAGRLGR